MTSSEIILFGGPYDGVLTEYSDQDLLVFGYTTQDGSVYDCIYEPVPKDKAAYLVRISYLGKIA